MEGILISVYYQGHEDEPGHEDLLVWYSDGTLCYSDDTIITVKHMTAAVEDFIRGTLRARILESVRFENL